MTPTRTDSTVVSFRSLVGINILNFLQAKKENNVHAFINNFCPTCRKRSFLTGSRRVLLFKFMLIAAGFQFFLCYGLSVQFLIVFILWCFHFFLSQVRLCSIIPVSNYMLHQSSHSYSHLVMLHSWQWTSAHEPVQHQRIWNQCLIIPFTWNKAIILLASEMRIITQLCQRIKRKAEAQVRPWLMSSSVI